MTPVERRTTAALAAVFAMRMMGLFVVLPVFAVYGRELIGATPLLIGLAIGAYGLLQGLLQIPYGLASDRFGRKPMIIVGLLLFAVGGVVAACSDTIWGVIAGRALQGGGAVAGVIMALLSDVTRESHRTRAMAVIGATIGLSFGLAMVVGPLIVAGTGLQGLFFFTSLMALVSLVLVLTVVPTPVVIHREQRPRVWPALVEVLRHPGLLRLDLGVFLLHLVMVAIFVVIPPALEAQGQLPTTRHWQVYLPVVLLALVAMVPLMMAAERRNRLRAAILLGAGLLVLSLLLLALILTTARQPLWGVALGLLLYFTAFNLLEALMPSLVSRLCPVGARGAAMGAYSSAQFFGAFAGGLLGGGLSALVAPEMVLLVCAALVLAWAGVAVGLRPDSWRRSLVLPLPANGDAQDFARQLLAMGGVLEVTLVPEDGIAHVIVDGARCDESHLRTRFG